MPTIEERMNEISQGYCTNRNSHKVLDSELLEDIRTIAVKIAKEYAEEQKGICEWEMLNNDIIIMSCNRPHPIRLGLLGNVTYKYCPYCGGKIEQLATEEEKH